MPTPSSSDAAFRDVTPDQLRAWMERGEAVLVDVREGFEHAAERIDGSHHHPLSSFDVTLVPKGDPGHRIVFHCKSGRRSADAAGRFAPHADAEVYQLEGGIESWKAAGLPTQRSARAPRIDVIRQVQITAGVLMLLAIVLGALVSPWFLALGAFVAAGQVFAGVTGWCGMAMVMASMPWNRA